MRVGIKKSSTKEKLIIVLNLLIYAAEWTKRFPSLYMRIVYGDAVL